jgi:hypothetical protein
MVPLGTTTLVDRASCIVEGRVTKVSSRWTDDHSTIITEVGIEVTDVLLGNTNQLTFCYQGGVVDDVEQQVSDMPAVKAGEQVLLFLRAPTPAEARRERAVATRGTRYTLLGAAQGLYRIQGSRASKDGFKVIGDATTIDRDLDATALKARIRERLKATGRKGGAL